METQELVDQMEDLIIDTSRSLYYANGQAKIQAPKLKTISSRAGKKSTAIKLLLSAMNTKITMENSQYICDVLTGQGRCNNLLQPERVQSSQQLCRK